MEYKVGTIAEPELAKAYIGDDGIYVPSRYDLRYHELLISKELFVEAYKKWIKNDNKRKYECLISYQDDADCWSDD